MAGICMVACKVPGCTFLHKEYLTCDMNTGMYLRSQPCVYIFKLPAQKY